MREHKGRNIELVEQQSGESNNSDDMEPKIIRAAEYLRMSTEHELICSMSSILINNISYLDKLS